MQQNEWVLVAIAALFLATKTEDQPIKLNQIIAVACKVKPLSSTPEVARMTTNQNQLNWLRDIILKVNAALFSQLFSSHSRVLCSVCVCFGSQLISNVLGENLCSAGSLLLVCQRG